MRQLCNDIDMIVPSHSPLTLVGDFNLPNVDWNGPVVGGEASKEFIFHSFCVSIGLTQLVNTVTRSRSSSIPDLVLTTQSDLIIDVKVMPAPVKSDHLAVHFDLLRPSLNNCNSSILDFTKTDYDIVSLNLSIMNWRQLFIAKPSVNDLYLLFVNHLLFLISLFTPYKSECCSSLESFVIRATKKQMGSNALDCSKLSKSLKKASRRLRVSTEASLNINDAKAFFRYANKRLNMRSGVSPLEHNGVTAVEDDDKSTILLNYFESVYVPPMDVVPTFASQTKNILNDVSFNIDVVHKKLCSLKP